MGWWDDSIMGGDDPLDYHYDFLEHFGLSRETKSGEEAARRVNDRLFDLFRKLNGRKGIGGQVLVVVIMEAGAGMPDSVRQFILDCLDADDWAQECPNRRRKVQAFRKQVEAYDGSAPVPCPEAWGQGLFEKMEGMFEKASATRLCCPSCGREEALVGGWGEYGEGPHQIELAPGVGLCTVSVFTCSFCGAQTALRRPEPS